MKHRAPRRDETTRFPWDAVPDLMYRVRGADGAIELLSAAFATHTGWSVADWIGRPFAELVYAEDLPRANDRYAAILRGEKPARYEMRIRTKAGGFVVGEFHSAPLLKQGRAVGEQGIARDITDRRRGEEARDEQFRALFESTDEALFLMDGAVFLDINPKGLEIFGLHDRSDIIGHSPVDFSPPLQPDGRASREKALAYILAALQGCPQRFFWKHARKDGATFDAEVSLHALTLHGRVHLQATVRDITARRAAEQAMRESKRRFRLLAAQVPADVWTTDTDLRLTSIYGSLVPAVERLDLRTVGTSLYELFATRDESHPVIAAHRRALGGVSAQYERTAGPMVIEGRVEPLRDGTGAIVGCVGVALDITERRSAEGGAARRLADFVESSEDAIITTAPDGTIQTWNPAAERLYGYPAREAVGRPITLFTPPDGAAELQRNMRLLEQGQPVEPYEAQRVRADGRGISVSVRLSAIRDGRGALIGFSGIVHDITGRKRAEDARQHREAELAESQRIAGIGSWEWTVATGVITWSDGLNHILGRGRGSPPPTFETLPQFYTPESWQRLGVVITRAVETGASYDIEVEMIRADGATCWTTTRGEAIGGADGTVVELRGTVHDITERKHAEDALRRSEAEYRSLVESAPLGIYRSTHDGRILTVNPAFVTMLGYAAANEVLGLDLARDVYVDPTNRAELVALLEQVDKAQVETQWKRKDASIITVRLNLRRVRDPAGRVEYSDGLVEDVTAQRSLENQFRQAQRLEAVGRLAGGVAHDFNNVLTAITGYSDLLLEELDPADPKRQDVEEIKAAAFRAAGLTRQLLTFSRKQVPETRVLDVNAVVENLEKMLRRLIGEDVKLEVSLGSGLGAVRADPGQLEQVIVNLAVNSRDAMPGGGCLTIETANVELDETHARDHAGASPGKYVVLAVTDTGIGMDAKIQSKIFDPFFTTKEFGKGTGLGLSVVYGIVKQSGGFVWVSSEPGRGATFKVYLPRVDELVEAQAQAPSVQGAAGGSETVLVAEDDPSVREIVANVLTRKGYRVLRAPDGQTALAMARAQQGEIQLLVTDIVMPGMTGRQLAEAFAVARPGVRVLYISGYTDDAVVRQGVLAEGLPYLQKPFTPGALALKVREVLDRP
jgi:two-component system cell cycle sensor histidine kinase/response regulator CckA